MSWKIDLVYHGTLGSWWIIWEQQNFNSPLHICGTISSPLHWHNISVVVRVGWQYFNILIGLKDYPPSLVMCTRPFVCWSVGFYQTLSLQWKVEAQKASNKHIFWPWIVKYLFCSCCLGLWQLTVITSVNQNISTNRPGQARLTANSTSNICHSKSFVEISAIFVNCFNTRFKHLFESQYWPI